MRPALLQFELMASVLTVSVLILPEIPAVGPESGFMMAYAILSYLFSISLKTTEIYKLLLTGIFTSVRQSLSTLPPLAFSYQCC